MKKLVLSLVIMMLLAGCSAKPYVVQHQPIKGEIRSSEVYVVSHGWHTGLVIPADEIQQRLPQLKARFGQVPFLELGWGDKGFYQAKEITSGLTLQAIFWPTDSVMHVVSVPIAVERFFPNSEVEKICLSKSELDSLVQFVSNSFYKDDAGNIVEQKNGLYGNSQFYQGEGNYYLMNTCNKWTAKGLKSAGMDIGTTFKLSASSVMGYLGEHDQAVSLWPVDPSVSDLELLVCE